MNVTHTKHIPHDFNFFYVDFTRSYYFKSETKSRRNIKTSNPNEERKTNVTEHD